LEKKESSVRNWNFFYTEPLVEVIFARPLLVAGYLNHCIGSFTFTWRRVRLGKNLDKNILKDPYFCNFYNRFLDHLRIDRPSFKSHYIELKNRV